MKPDPPQLSPKAREKPRIDQAIEVIAIDIKHCIRSERVMFRRVTFFKNQKNVGTTCIIMVSTDFLGTNPP